MLIVDVEAFESSAAELDTEAGITFSSYTLYSSSSPIRSTESQATYDQPLLIKATILAFGQLAKAANLQATTIVSYVPNLIEEAIANALRPCVEVELKQRELMEAQNLRID